MKQSYAPGFITPQPSLCDSDSASDTESGVLNGHLSWKGNYSPLPSTSSSSSNQIHPNPLVVREQYSSPCSDSKNTSPIEAAPSFTTSPEIHTTVQETLEPPSVLVDNSLPPSPQPEPRVVRNRAAPKWHQDYVMH